MGVPKNYNQLEKRVEALNDLTFYTVSYDYKFNEDFKNTMENKYDTDDTTAMMGSINGVKKFTALNDESADKKVDEWLGSLVKKEILDHFEVTGIKSHGFYEEIKDKKLDGILNIEKGT